ncbi:MAG: RNA polymerase sigma factor SigJ [Nitratireductor sp.]
MNDQADPERLGAFLQHRPRLLRLAYRHLGAVADAEDVVQEAWLRFDGAGEVRNAAGLLSTIVTRLCLDRMKSTRARRETYVGEWLPEPVSDASFETEDNAALDISFAVMRALERLSPAERAAYFLHDLWDLPFEEIARTLSRSPAACRKLASRARAGLAEARQRFQPSRDDVDRLVAAFRISVEAGDPSRLKSLLAEDAELVSDGGGKALAALKTIHGADAVSRFLVGIGRKAGHPGQITVQHALINGQPGLLVSIDGHVDQTLVFDLDAARRIRSVYVVRNPDKLARLTRTRLSGQAPAGGSFRI